MHGTSGQAVNEKGRHVATILDPFLSRIGRHVRVAIAVLTPVVLALLISSTAIAQGQAAPTPDWQYGGFLDVAYLNSFNDPLQANRPGLGQRDRAVRLAPAEHGARILAHPLRHHRRMQGPSNHDCVRISARVGKSRRAGQPSGVVAVRAVACALVGTWTVERHGSTRARLGPRRPLDRRSARVGTVGEGDHRDARIPRAV